MIKDRDAIHIAIATVVAGQDMSPGEHISLIEQGLATTTRKPHIGIVDPFRADDVKEGQEFRIFLYPGTITSLRHEWAHPAIDFIETSSPKEDPGLAPHTRWMERFAREHDVTYGWIMRAAARFAQHGEFSCHPEDGGQFEGEHVPDEFWDHYQAIAGVVPREDQGNFFTCSC